MERPYYLSKYLFDWEVFDVILGGQSALDASSFLGDFTTKEKAGHFLVGYGFDPGDLVIQSELFGNFQEAIQFIKKYFLKENNPEGLDLTVPGLFSTITDVRDLFLLATRQGKSKSYEERIWAGIILKVMHTIIHADKDLRHNYFSTIQQQIFDRFYKYLSRDKDNLLYLGKSDSDENKILLYDFDTKSKKTRDSIIIKLLHKAENVAEELFDRIGVRFITHTRLDSLRVVKFLQENNIIIPHNIKPSRSLNTLINLKVMRQKYKSLIRMSIRNNLSEDRFVQALNRETLESTPEQKFNDKNTHSSIKFRTIQFTCRQLIKYKDPFMAEFNSIRKFAKNLKSKGQDGELVKKILELDLSLIAKDIRFFYPFEVQIVDLENHRINTEGEASHQDYKKSQLKTAMARVFRPLLEFKGIKI